MKTTLPAAPSPRYVIVSPVKDEERCVAFTLRSVTGQTVRPVEWIIVDDGSRDRTAEIVRGFAREHSFIQLLSHPRAGSRQLAFGEVRAFNWGCEMIAAADYDFIVKLDCDLSFDADYFGALLERFRRDDRLGIASGIYRERNAADGWQAVSMPSYHAAGASKVVRKSCYQDINGFIPAPGWDTVDEIKAMARGWTTAHFTDLIMDHHKREGSSIGAIRTNVMQGEAFYRSGGSTLFFGLKVIRRMFSKPYLVSALSQLWGYLRALATRRRLLVTENEARLYRALLLGRLRTEAISWFRKG